MAMSVKSLGTLLNKTLKPFLQAELPRAHPRKVLPEPVAPVMSTFRLSQIQVQEDNCRMVHLFNFLYFNDILKLSKNSRNLLNFADYYGNMSISIFQMNRGVI